MPALLNGVDTVVVPTPADLRKVPALLTTGKPGRLFRSPKTVATNALFACASSSAPAAMSRRPEPPVARLFKSNRPGGPRGRATQLHHPPGVNAQPAATDRGRALHDGRPGAGLRAARERRRPTHGHRPGPGQRPPAEIQLQSLHQNAPGDVQVSNQLALTLAEQVDKTKQGRTVQLAEVNARAYANVPEMQATLGWVYYRLGRIDEAERALQAALSQGKSSAETAYYLAHVLSERGRMDDAQKLLRGALATSGPFVFRKEAQEWLERMTKKP